MKILNLWLHRFKLIILYVCLLYIFLLINLCKIITGKKVITISSLYYL